MHAKRLNKRWKYPLRGPRACEGFVSLVLSLPRAGIAPLFLKLTLERESRGEARKGKLQATVRSHRGSALLGSWGTTQSTPHSLPSQPRLKWVQVPLGRWIPQTLGSQALLPEKGLRRKVSGCRKHWGGWGQWAGPGARGGVIWCVPSDMPDSHYFYLYDLAGNLQPHPQQVFPVGHSATPQERNYPLGSTSLSKSIFYVSCSPHLASHLAWQVFAASLRQAGLLSVSPGSKFALFLQTIDIYKYTEWKSHPLLVSASLKAIVQ